MFTKPGEVETCYNEHGDQIEEITRYPCKKEGEPGPNEYSKLVIRTDMTLTGIGQNVLLPTAIVPIRHSSHQL